MKQRWAGVARRPSGTRGRRVVSIVCPDVILFLRALCGLSLYTSRTLLVKQLQKQGKIGRSSMNRCLLEWIIDAHWASAGRR